MDRPALRRLVADVNQGFVDLVVIYKVGPLTRSLSDFAKMDEAFDAHGVSFVAVTRSTARSRPVLDSPLAPFSAVFRSQIFDKKRPKCDWFVSGTPRREGLGRWRLLRSNLAESASSGSMR
jgi:hypothetical protein